MHELASARGELIDRELIAFEHGVYQVMNLPPKRVCATG
jgi:hypothetical protein